MEKREEKSNNTEMAECNMSVLQTLEKAELIKRCLDFKLALDNARKETESYRSLLIDSVKAYNLLKTKNPDIDNAEYNTSWSWVNKIVFVLKKINRPLLSTEIIAFLTPYEPILQHSHHRAQAFSANLTKAVKYGRVRAYKLAGSRGYYYIIAAWLDSDGNLSKEYENKIFFK
jgi:hypothetical protein